ncbi:hypothetical protein GCM10010389_21650 [Streptomyces echinoruber]|uniref:Uncharacterized protein n=1 Tax=Streptomyces echinoruber TaxID=68898 RepID=A0A918R1A2_9ACTN|nr:hypothetical protein GCM10010389_21650 [Streptomyces echinoruber]
MPFGRALFGKHVRSLTVYLVREGFLCPLSGRCLETVGFLLAALLIRFLYPLGGRCLETLGGSYPLPPAVTMSVARNGRGGGLPGCDVSRIRLVGCRDLRKHRARKVAVRPVSA